MRLLDRRSLAPIWLPILAGVVVFVIVAGRVSVLPPGIGGSEPERAVASLRLAIDDPLTDLRGYVDPDSTLSRLQALEAVGAGDATRDEVAATIGVAPDDLEVEPVARVTSTTPERTYWVQPLGRNPLVEVNAVARTPREADQIAQAVLASLRETVGTAAGSGGVTTLPTTSATAIASPPAPVGRGIVFGLATLLVVAGGIALARHAVCSSRTGRAVGRVA